MCSLLARFFCSFICAALVLPSYSFAQERAAPKRKLDGMLRLSCEGTLETTTVSTSTIAGNNGKSKERKLATITINLDTGFAYFQNLGQIAFNSADEPIKCIVDPDEIRCAKEHSPNSDMWYSSSVVINRYSGLLTEFQKMTSASVKNPFMTTFSGEYKCKTLDKPQF